MGKKLTIYMINETAYGPRLAEIGNWVGKALYSPRVSVSTLLSRSECENPGIYCLKGDPTDSAFNERVYIGEAENIRKRLRQHLSDPNKDFNELIFFISKDDLLTKAHVKYLESRLVQRALAAKSAQIDNSTSPSLPALHEADISDMEYFLTQMELVLPVMGFNFLIPSTVAPESQPTAPAANAAQHTYTISARDVIANMTETAQGYVVKKGSQAKKETTNSFPKTYQNLRKKLLETGILLEQEHTLTFAEDAVFNSPSAASNIVLGRNSNGLAEWKNEAGHTLKEVQEQNEA